MKAVLIVVAIALFHCAFVHCERIVYVGAYQTNGILIYKQNATTGALTQVGTAPGNQASWLALHPNGRFLYSNCELSEGQFESWRINPQSGELTKLNSVASNGDSPAFFSIYPTGDFFLGSNYGTGNFLVYKLSADNGKIGEKTFDSIPGSPSWGIPDRQSGPHAHCIVTAPKSDNVIGVDLGADKAFSWKLDKRLGRLTPTKQPYTQVLTGSGARHIVFHDKLSYAYIINEMGSTVDVYHYEPQQGIFTAEQHISTLPRPTAGSTGAEIRIHPNGRYLYATNRGADSIAIFKIDQDNGLLTTVGFVASGGKTPRGMNIAPEGNFMYVANQNGNNVVVFAIENDGAVLKQSSQVGTSSPVAVIFSDHTTL